MTLLHIVILVALYGARHFIDKVMLRPWTHPMVKRITDLFDAYPNLLDRTEIQQQSRWNSSVGKTLWVIHSGYLLQAPSYVIGTYTLRGRIGKRRVQYQFPGGV